MRVVRLWRRALAEAIFFGRALRSLTPPIVGLVVIWLVGAILHRYFGAPPGGPVPSWSTALFNSYCLLFMEHIFELPAHPVGQLVQYAQPVFGVFLMIEGVLRLGAQVFRKSENALAWVEIMAKVSRGHIVLCGAGNVGFRVLEELLHLGEEVYVIEANEDAPFLERARSAGAQVVVGDARDDHLLRRLNIQDARAIIIATNNDLANLEIAMDVREIRADIPIVMRLFDQRLARKVRHTLGIQVSFSTSQLAAPLFASAALDPSVVGTHRVGEELLVVMELAVAAGGRFANNTVAWLSQNAQLTVLALSPKGETEWAPQPPPGTRIAPGDRVQVLVSSRRVSEVHGLNAAPEAS
ncbi:MAG: NAD-binding protein [Alphaproteobacteria bacterium]|nr:NAD-binding protein [Alphaproteobacteria bacterium]